MATHYKTLGSEEQNAYISPHITGDYLYVTKDRLRATPENPNPKQIKGMFTPYREAAERFTSPRPEPTRHSAITTITDRDYTYGPSTGSYGSLRHYGVGPW
jgi:hypothetical protein